IGGFQVIVGIVIFVAQTQIGSGFASADKLAEFFCTSRGRKNKTADGDGSRQNGFVHDKAPWVENDGALSTAPAGRSGAHYYLKHYCISGDSETAKSKPSSPVC